LQQFLLGGVETQVKHKICLPSGKTNLLSRQNTTPAWNEWPVIPDELYNNYIGFIEVDIKKTFFVYILCPGV